jgi:hypothetical protein
VYILVSNLNANNSTDYCEFDGLTISVSPGCLQTTIDVGFAVRKTLEHNITEELARTHRSPHDLHRSDNLSQEVCDNLFRVAMVGELLVIFLFMKHRALIGDYRLPLGCLILFCWFLIGVHLCQ